MKHEAHRRAWRALAGAALAATLAAALGGCGGGEIVMPPPASPAAEDPALVPASATANAAAFSNYVATRPASDTADPLVVGTLVPPVSDTDEPVAVTR